MNSANGIPVKNFKTYEGYFQKENHKIEHDEDDNSINSFRPINDEDLLKACGGRTAHKYAHSFYYRTTNRTTNRTSAISKKHYIYELFQRCTPWTNIEWKA